MGAGIPLVPIRSSILSHLGNCCPREQVRIAGEILRNLRKKLVTMAGEKIATHYTCGTTQPSVYCRGVARHFAFAYRSAYFGATRKPRQSSWGHALLFRTVPSANTLVRWVNENAFAFIRQARPCPTFGRPVHRRGSPHRLRPGTAESARGISPRAAHRTGCDGLPSSGSCSRERFPPFV